MQFKKADLDGAVSAVSEGLSNNSYVKLSTTITLYPSDGKLFLVTYPEDGEVWYSAEVGEITEQCSPISVDGAQFAKAISCCSDVVSLTITADSLVIDNGKGELKLPIVLGDDNAPAHHDFFTPAGDALTVAHLNQLKLVSNSTMQTMDSIALKTVYTDAEVSFSTDSLNISKGDSIVNVPMLLSGRMLSFLGKHGDTEIFDAGQEFFWFKSEKDKCNARFSKLFQDFLPEFPVEPLKEEFAKPVKNSVNVDISGFLKALSFLSVVTSGTDDYAVSLSQEQPNELILSCGTANVQRIPCEQLNGDGPWKVVIDCSAAVKKFGQYTGKVQLDVYDTMLALVGPVTTSIGLLV